MRSSTDDLSFAGQRVVAVSTGVGHSLALTADGAVFIWGEGGHGCLGHGDDLSNDKPAAAEEDRDVGARG